MIEMPGTCPLYGPLTMMDGVNTYSVFAIENGVVKIVNAKIDIAQINNLFIGTERLLPGSLINIKTFSSPTEIIGTTQADLVINHGLAPNAATPFQAKIEAKGIFRFPYNYPGTGSLQIIDMSSNTIISQTETGAGGSGQRTQNPYLWSKLATIPTDRASSTYRVIWNAPPSPAVGDVPRWIEREAVAIVFKQAS